jgi:hypothetical protein
LSYGIVGYNNFVKMMQQMLRTNKKLIFSDIYSDDEYCREFEMNSSNSTNSKTEEENKVTNEGENG